MSTTQSRIVLLQEPRQRLLILLSTDIYSSKIPITISLHMRIGRLGNIQKLDIYTMWTWQMREEALFTISSSPRRKVLLNPSPRRQHLLDSQETTSTPIPSDADQAYFSTFTKVISRTCIAIQYVEGIKRDTNRVLHKCEYVIRLRYKL